MARRTVRSALFEQLGCGVERLAPDPPCTQRNKHQARRQLHPQVPVAAMRLIEQEALTERECSYQDGDGATNLVAHTFSLPSRGVCWRNLFGYGSKARLSRRSLTGRYGNPYLQ